MLCTFITCPAANIPVRGNLLDFGCFDIPQPGYLWLYASQCGPARSVNFLYSSHSSLFFSFTFYTFPDLHLSLRFSFVSFGTFLRPHLSLRFSSYYFFFSFSSSALNLSTNLPLRKSLSPSLHTNVSPLSSIPSSTQRAQKIVPSKKQKPKNNNNKKKKTRTYMPSLVTTRYVPLL